MVGVIVLLLLLLVLEDADDDENQQRERPFDHSLYTYIHPPLPPFLVFVVTSPRHAISSNREECIRIREN